MPDLVLCVNLHEKIHLFHWNFTHINNTYTVPGLKDKKVQKGNPTKKV